MGKIKLALKGRLTRGRQSQPGGHQQDQGYSSIRAGGWSQGREVKTVTNRWADGQLRKGCDRNQTQATNPELRT